MTALKKTLQRHEYNFMENVNILWRSSHLRIYIFLSLGTFCGHDYLFIKVDKVKTLLLTTASQIQTSPLRLKAASNAILILHISIKIAYHQNKASGLKCHHASLILSLLGTVHTCIKHPMWELLKKLILYYCFQHNRQRNVHTCQEWTGFRCQCASKSIADLSEVNECAAY